MTAMLRAGLVAMRLERASGDGLRHDHRRSGRAAARNPGDARKLGINLRDIPSGAAHPASASVATRPRRLTLSRRSGAPSATSRPPARAPPRRARERRMPRFPTQLRRNSEFLQHAVFHQYRSETEMLRYMRRLADRDLALDRCMIPLGSCTMKLNATAEMMPRDLAGIRRTASLRARRSGARLCAGDCRAGGDMLCKITGYDAISFQPNSGAQGEYAGPARHPRLASLARAEAAAPSASFRRRRMAPIRLRRTWPAWTWWWCAATTAAMSISTICAPRRARMPSGSPRSWSPIRRPTACSRKRCARSAISFTATAARSISTAPISTRKSGLARPGDYGADVGHINLHKTFCIPHGGGGPGMGPIGVKAHLAPFLPGHPARAGRAARRRAGFGRALRLGLHPPSFPGSIV